MHISNNGLALIKQYEGFRAHPYGPPADVWTIGYGETKGIGPHSGPWTEAYAAKRLVARVRANYEPYVRALGVRLNQHQFDAIVSAVYNLGPGVLARGRSLGDALRSRRDSGYNHRVAAALRLYSMPGTQFHEGLLARRNKEAALFAKPVETAKQHKVRAWESELAKLRLAVRKTNKWTPAQKNRAKSLEQAINRTHRTAKK